MCQPPQAPQPKRKRGRRGRRRDGAVPKQLNPLKPQFCDFAQRWGAWQQRLDTSKPLVVDVGCGEGEWCVAAAAISGTWVLGDSTDGTRYFSSRDPSS